MAPFSPLGLNVFSELYWRGDIPPNESNLMLSLIPFLAGFSTNLVLVVLGKFVVAIEFPSLACPVEPNGTNLTLGTERRHAEIASLRSQ